MARIGGPLLSFWIELPPRQASPNDHRHHRTNYKRFKAIAAYRLACFAACYQAMQLAGVVPVKDRKAARKVRISTVWYMADTPIEKALRTVMHYRPMDVDNAIASLKAAIDGFVDAHLVGADDYKHLDWGETVLHRTRKAHGGRSGIEVLVVEVNA